MTSTRDQEANSSEIVESPLKDFAERKHQQRFAKAHDATITTWNNFGDNVSSFADEHITL